MKPIKILLLEEQQLFRESLARLISCDSRFEVTGTSGDLDEALSIYAGNPSDVLLVETHMSPVDGFTATQQFKAAYPGIRVLGLSEFCLPVLVKKFFRLGASGYINKNVPGSELLHALDVVGHGQIYMSEEVKVALFSEEISPVTETSGWSSLTQKELMVVQGVKNGKTSRMLAGEMGVSPKTVEGHRYRILKKLHIKNTAALVQYANLQGI